LIARIRRHADVLVIAVLAAGLAAAGWAHRWVTDDGLIYDRAVRQVLAGHGPVFDAGQRVETTTSALWLWLLTAASWITGTKEPARLSVYLGLVLAVVGLLAALDATRRLHRAGDAAGREHEHALSQRRRTRSAVDDERQWLVPAGALVVLALPPFWEFATSGLETGLELAWAGGLWWFLVQAWQGGDGRPWRGRAVWLGAIWIGLGPLVRPDFGLLTVLGFIAFAWLARAGWKRWLLLAAAGAALPMAYEVFRLGYYGLPYPTPGVTKDASRSMWTHGWYYTRNFVGPYWLWIAMAAAAGLLVGLWWRRPMSRRTLVVVATPLVLALAEALYVARVGGDFMHGRMWLVPTLLALAPVLVVPARPRTAPAVAVLAVWSAVGVVTFGGVDKGTHDPYPNSAPPTYCDAKACTTLGLWVWDERANYLLVTGDAHPVDESVHIESLPNYAAQFRAAAKGRDRVLVFEPFVGITEPLPLGRTVPGHVALVAIRLGRAGAEASLDDTVIDVLGLANPIGARIDAKPGYVVGHQKWLPPVWAVALLTDGSDDAQILAAMPPTVNVTAATLAAARHTLTCGPVKELLDSVHAPLTLSRFVHNATGALRRARLHIPSDPMAAEARFCG
jgi:arabinofuranosyltransferase